MAKQGAGLSDSFDDLILDPEGSSEGGTPPAEEDSWAEDVDTEETPQPASKSSKQSSKEGLETFENLDSPMTQLDVKEDDKTKEEEDNDEDKKGEGEKEKPKDGKEGEGKEGEKTTETKTEEAPKIPGKSVRAIFDGKAIDIPTDAKVKTKVGDKWERVTIQELRDNYSGKAMWDKKFPELQEKENSLSRKEQELTQVHTTIKSTLEDLTTSVKSALEGKGNPLDAINKIIDLINVDSYDFNKALFESLHEEFVNFDQMDEVERKAYWLEKQTNHLQKRHETFEEKMKASKAQEDRLRVVDTLREKAGVSEEDFVSAYEQLAKTGAQVTPEQVVNYAANLPFVTTAEELLTPYEDQFSDSEFEGMMAKIAHTMKNDKSITKEDMAQWLAENYEVEELVQTVNEKASKSGAHKERRATGTVPSQHDLYARPSFESFDDFEN